MGVPITFLDKYNPDQFEIIGLGISNSGIEIGVNLIKKNIKNSEKKFKKGVQLMAICISSKTVKLKFLMQEF
jgi:hypothetical protein